MRLYEPIQIGSVQLKNRIVSPPMLPCLATQEGRITSDLIAFAGRLAKAGAGLVSMGETSIDSDRSFDHIGAINLGSDKYVPSLTLLAEEVHRYGAKISIEINHSGACAEPMLLDAGKHGVSPSPLPAYMHPQYKGNTVELLTRKMMDQVVENYLAAVGRPPFSMALSSTTRNGHDWGTV